MTMEPLPVASRDATRGLARELLRGRQATVLAALAMFLISGVAALVPPWILGTIVDDVRAGRDRILTLGAIIAGSALVSAIVASVAVALLAQGCEPAVAQLRETALSKALHLDLVRLERAGTGDLASRLADDARMITQSLYGVIPSFLGSVVAIAATGVLFFALDWHLGLVGLATIPLYAAGLRWYLPRSRPLYRDQRAAQGMRAQALLNAIHAAPTLRAFGIEREHLGRVVTQSQRVVALSSSAYRLLLRFLGRNNVAELTGMTMVLGGGFVLAQHHVTSLGTVAAAALYFQRLFGPVGGLLFVFDQVQSTGASLSRLAGVALLDEQVGKAAKGAPAGAGGVDLALRHVTHEYVPGRKVVRDANLRIGDGERVAIVGASGAGKSTLVSIAAGLVAPAAGEVTLNERNLHELDPREVRSTIAVVAQDAHVFAGTVRDLVTLGAPSATDEAVENALADTGVTSWLSLLPDGVQTLVGDDGYQLTPAQAQQLALARVLLLNPSVVVLDEATADAGSAGAREVEAAAFVATRGRSSLIVAHRLAQAASADRVVVMHDAAIVEEGTHEGLLAAGGRYSDLWAAYLAR